MNRLNVTIFFIIGIAGPQQIRLPRHPHMPRQPAGNTPQRAQANPSRQGGVPTSTSGSRIPGAPQGPLPNVPPAFLEMFQAFTVSS